MDDRWQWRRVRRNLVAGLIALGFWLLFEAIVYGRMHGRGRRLALIGGVVAGVGIGWAAAEVIFESKKESQFRRRGFPVERPEDKGSPR